MKMTTKKILEQMAVLREAEEYGIGSIEWQALASEIQEECFKSVVLMLNSGILSALDCDLAYMTEHAELEGCVIVIRTGGDVE